MISSPKETIDQDETQDIFSVATENEPLAQQETREEESAAYTNLRSAKLLSLISGKPR